MDRGALVRKHEQLLASRVIFIIAGVLACGIRALYHLHIYQKQFIRTKSPAFLHRHSVYGSAHSHSFVTSSLALTATFR